jgi:prepilin peptidase CpaA
MDLTQLEAMWFLPLALPLCLYVCFTDMREMRITNQAVIALALVFVLLGPLALPFDQYAWRLAQMVAMLLLGMVLNSAGAMGAGDAKFIAAAAPFVASGDLRFLIGLFAAVLLAAFCTHRLAKYTGLRQIAPHWVSWERGKKFPMGMALGACLAIYLGFGLFFGQ